MIKRSLRFLVIVGILITICALAFYACDQYLPYGPYHFAQIEAFKTRMEVLAWARAGSNDVTRLQFTNASSRGYLFDTNLHWNQRSYPCFFKVESRKLRGLGALHATTNGEIFLLHGSGKVELVQP
jgi:hypothetical protein